MDRLEIKPAAKISGTVSVPGDKSISHRLGMLGAIAQGTTVIRNFAASVDCRSTLECLRRLGAKIDQTGSTVTILGRGLQELQAPLQELDAGNSGTTVRLMSGIVSGLPFESTFIGDESLSRRPMKRIIDPLRRFGATIQARDDNYLPLKIKGGPLEALDFDMPVASAQVKSAVLLAGLQARGVTKVHESVPSRNHTEIALAHFGAHIKTQPSFEAAPYRAGAPRLIEIEGGHQLQGKEVTVPGDLSSAAFFIAAVLAVPNSRLRLTSVGLNPTRTGFISLLEEVRARISVSQLSDQNGEPAGDITVETSDLAGMDIGGAWIPNIIDEIPMLAVLGTRTRKGIRIRDAAELRAKESDRIRAVARNLQALGAQVEEYSDGLFVPGEQRLHGGVVDSFDDHRIAMAFAIGALFAEGPVTIERPDCVAISFPGFFELLDQVSG
jgi:3-phosphoshikimate 1-carboxyvinyltransferase